MKNKLLEIINHYGVSNQQRKLNEEVFELQEAIFNYEEQKRVCEQCCSRLHCDREREHIAEELADCLNLLSQFADYYEIDDDEVYAIAEQKIYRQIERIKNGN